MKKIFFIALATLCILTSCTRENEPPIFKFYDGDNEIVSAAIDIPINTYKEIKIIAIGPSNKTDYPFLGNCLYTLILPDGETSFLYGNNTYNQNCFKMSYQAENSDKKDEEISTFFMTFNDSICKVGDQYILNVHFDWDEPVEKSLKINIVE